MRSRSGYGTVAVTRQVMSAFDAIVLPPGYVPHPAAEIESRDESFGGIGSAICPRHHRW